MRIVINTSNIKQSGALQVTLSFIEELKNIKKHAYLILLSSQVKSQIDMTSFPDNFRFVEVSFVPPFTKGYLSYRKELAILINEENPDCVFSIFGPTYWKPSIPHIYGFAYPWAINQDSKFIKALPLKQWLKQRLEVAFKTFFMKREADLYVVETKDVKSRLTKHLSIPESQIEVVSNTFNHYFDSYKYEEQVKLIDREKGDEFRLLTVSSNFPHKNLSIIKDVSLELQNRGYNNFHFYVTIPPKDGTLLFGSNSNIHCLGTVKASECPRLYAECDAMFLPTQLECFTATYPEAMKMRKPIVTSNLDFAKAICGDAAMYFDPFSPKSIADILIRLKSDESVYKELVEKGLEILKTIPSAAERASQYISICERFKRST
ncbi:MULTISPECIES: glycosyltransferase [Olivibacter]|uniref:Glycosyltransferase n=1 Tax=Olivibacter jilunii TaxID=985016 RepID=A0ABW6B7B4_9SPHI